MNKSSNYIQDTTYSESFNKLIEDQNLSWNGRQGFHDIQTPSSSNWTTEKGVTSLKIANDAKSYLPIHSSVTYVSEI